MAARRYLVDGYNYLHRARMLGAAPLAPGKLEAARRALVRRLRPLTREGALLEVIWDSRGRPDVAGEIAGEAFVEPESRFSGGVSADEEILERVREAGRGAGLVVVTDDRELAARAEQLGARALRVSEVEERLRPPAGSGGAGTGASDRDAAGADDKPPPPRTRAEVAEWERYFAEGGDPADG